MKKLSYLIVGLGLAIGVHAQQADTTKLTTNHDFTGAVAKSKMYHAIYQLDTKDPAIIKKAIRNINNALNDPRLKGHLQLELVTFAGGTDAALKGSEFENDLKNLVMQGVIVAQCANSMKERNITRDQIHDFMAVVPSGNGELIIRQGEGWAIVKP